MLERDSEYFSKYAIDPNLDDYFDGFDLPEFGFKTNTEPEPNLVNISLDEMDEEMWGEF